MEQINAQDYLEMNKEYLALNEEIQNKIKEELTQNKADYPAGAEEVYFFDYGEEISPDDENKLGLIHSLLKEKLSDDYARLYELRDKIIALAGHVSSDKNLGENVGEN